MLSDVEEANILQQSDVNKTDPVATLIDTKKQTATTSFSMQIVTFS